MKIAIIGTGAYSFAMAKVLSQKNQITMWTESVENIEKFKSDEYLDGIIKGYKLSKNIIISTSFKETLENAELVIIMVAAKFVSSVMKNAKEYLKKDIPIAVCSKGIDQTSCAFLHEIILKEFKTRHLAIISGPSFAIDVASFDPIALALATKSSLARETILKAFKDTSVKLRPTKDIIGLEICGSIKNVIAIASGIISGIGYSDSTLAFLITESLHDIKALIKALGGKGKTVITYAGIGDLLLTCSSSKSRNFSLGVLIGNGAKQEEIQNYLKTTTVEGFYTLESISKLLNKKNVKIPIINLIYKITIEGENPKSLVEFLMKK